MTLKHPRSLFSTRKFVNVDVVSVTPACMICSAKIDSDLVPLGISNDYVTFIFEGEQVRRLDVKAKITRDFDK